MSITIAPSDFTADIVDTVQPLLDALGLLDNNGKLDIENWNAQKAMGVFETYERTETILDLISGFTGGLPDVFYRQKQYDNGDGTLSASGLLYPDNDGDTQGFEREEWFKIYPFDDSVPWSVYLTVIHTGSGSSHDVKIGVGVSYLANVSSNDLDCRVSIPIMKIDTTTNPGSITTTPLIWSESSATSQPLQDIENSGARISISGRLKPDNDVFSVSSNQVVIECKAISLQAAVGKSGAKVILILEDYGEKGGLLEDMVIDSWDGAGGAISNIMNGIVDLLLGKLPDGRIKDDLLPILGLFPSDEFKTDFPSGVWPELDIMEIVSHIDDPLQLWGVLRNWVSSVADNPDVFQYYIKHIFRLITGETWGNIVVTGTGTKDNPWALTLNDSVALDLILLFSTYLDSDNIRWVDVGIKTEVTKTDGTVGLSGEAVAQLFSIPLSSSANINLLPLLEGSFTIQPSNWSISSPIKLVSLSAGADGNPLGNLSLDFERGRAALRMDEEQGLFFSLELLQVDVADTHWDVLDLTSADTPLNLFNALTSSLMDVISDYFSTNDLLRWVGSLVGICAPRCDSIPVNSGDFAYIWYDKGNSGTNDLRIKITDVISNPLKALMQYHCSVLNSTIDWGGVTYPAWVFLFESVGNIIAKVANDDFVSPTESSDVPGGSGTEISPWYYSITPDGDLPTISLTCWIDSTSNSIVFGLEVLLAMVYISEQIQLTAKIWTTIVDVDLSDTNNTVDEVEWIPAAGAGVAFENYLKIVGGDHTPPYRIELEPIVGLHAGLQEISAKIKWERNDGVEWDIAIVEPGVYVIYPDWKTLFANIDSNSNSLEWADLDMFHWDGIKISLPDGTFVWPTINFALNQFTFTPVSIPKFDGSGNFSLSFTGFSIGVPWFDGAGGNDPNFGFGSSGQYFDINLPTISLADHTDVDISIIIEFLGRIISCKLGKFGFFLSGFFRLNMDIPSFNLDLHLGSLDGDFNLPFIDLPNIGTPTSWQRSGGLDGWGMGLHPFQLPIDWPSIDWSSFDLEDPWPALKAFFLEIFGGTSRSGEPFAFPALRWIWGLFSGQLPDLRLPDLGWGGDGNFNTLSFPDVPFEVLGDGSYNNPFSVPLTPFGMQTIELLVWLDPDGLPSTQVLDLAKASLDPQLLGMLESGIDSVKTAAMNDENWTTQIARLLTRMSYVSPRIEAAIKGLSEQEIQRGLMVFNDFMQNSDGLVPHSSQAGGLSFNPSSSLTEIAMHWNALETPDVITSAKDFLLHNSAINTVYLLIQAPWNDGDVWDPFLAQAGPDLGVTSPASHFDLTDADTPGVTLSSIDLSQVSQSEAYTLKLSTKWPENGDEINDQILQVELCIQHILNMEPSGTVVALVGHSVGGLAVGRYVSSSSGLSSQVVCASTIATPHEGFTLDAEKESQLRTITHILELIGFGGRSQTSITWPANVLGQSANRADVEKTVTMITQHRQGMGDDLGGGI